MPITAVPGHSHRVVRFVITPDVAQSALRTTKARVGDHLKQDGVVSLVKGSKLAMDATDRLGVVRVHGKIDVDALWGGKEVRSFSALVDTNAHTLAQFRSW